MIPINQKDCAKTVKNLGVPDCVIKNGRLTTILLVSDASWTTDVVSDTFDKATVNALIQDGTFIPVVGAVEIKNNTPEATTEEFQGGIMNVVRNGLPMFAAKFVDNWAKARALSTMNSFAGYKVLLGFEDGSISGVLNGTTFSPYTLGMLNTGTYFHADGAASGNVTMVFQLTNADEYNLYTEVIDRSVLDFSVNDLLPVTDIKMTGRAIAGDKVYFKAVYEQNQAVQLGGISIADLVCTIDGVADTIVALSLSYNSTTKEWSFTPTTNTGTSTVVVKLSTAGAKTAKIGQKFYKGETEPFISID